MCARALRVDSRLFDSMLWVRGSLGELTTFIRSHTVRAIIAQTVTLSESLAMYVKIDHLYLNDRILYCVNISLRSSGPMVCVYVV